MKVRHLAIALTLLPVATFADSSIVDLSANNQPAMIKNVAAPIAMVPETKIIPATTVYAAQPQESLSVEQRLTKIEQQLNNLTQMNLPARIDSLQQEVQKLNGSTEQHDHDLKALNDQLRAFYKDLEQRLNQVKPVAGEASTRAHSSGSTLDNNLTSEASGSTLQTANSTLPSAATNTATVTDQQSVPKEQKTYEEGLTFLQQKKYVGALEKFKSYVNNYPKGAYIINAHYWLGESYYLLNQRDAAIAEFKLITTKYPTSTKAPNALRKLEAINRTVKSNIVQKPDDANMYH